MSLLSYVKFEVFGTTIWLKIVLNIDYHVTAYKEKNKESTTVYENKLEGDNIDKSLTLNI